MTEVIASRDNERVKRACKLRDSGARRAAEGRFLAEGLRLCTDLAQRLPPEEVYCTQKLLDAHPELAALGGRHFLVSDAVAAKLSGHKGPAGAVLCVSPPDKNAGGVRGGGRYVCLEHIQDPANVGALLRSAAAFGFAGAVLCGNCARPILPQGGAGLHGHAGKVDIIFADETGQALAAFKACGIPSFAAALQNSVPLERVDTQRLPRGGASHRQRRQRPFARDRSRGRQSRAHPHGGGRGIAERRRRGWRAAVAFQGGVAMGGARAQVLEEKTAWLWMAAALGPGAPNSGMALSMFPDARALAQACWKEDLSMVFTPAQLAAACGPRGRRIIPPVWTTAPGRRERIDVGRRRLSGSAARSVCTAARAVLPGRRGHPQPLLYICHCGNAAPLRPTAWRRRRPSRANCPGGRSACLRPCHRGLTARAIRRPSRRARPRWRASPFRA